MRRRAMGGAAGAHTMAARTKVQNVQVRKGRGASIRPAKHHHIAAHGGHAVPSATRRSRALDLQTVTSCRPERRHSKSHNQLNCPVHGYSTGWHLDSRPRAQGLRVAGGHRAGSLGRVRFEVGWSDLLSPPLARLVPRLRKTIDTSTNGRCGLQLSAFE